VNDVHSLLQSGADDWDGRAEDELRDFSYIVSHDLATEIRHMAEFAKLLTRNVEVQPDARARSNMEIILAASDKCQAMLEALRVYSQVQQAPLAPRSCDASSVVGNAVARAGEIIRANEAQVSIDVSGVIWGDAQLLVNSFRRVIENAVQFRRPGAPARVKLLGREEEGAWTLRVADAGVGLEERFWERAFRMFWRLEPRGAGRIGAGLAICRRILRRHGGDARFVACDHGACLKIALPGRAAEVGTGAAG
jgi:light-regulated signal transduction histidine kinase (bacteriophytochrome)